MPKEGAATVPQDLLEILVCPVDRAKVRLDGEWLLCEGCGRAYPVRDGIPIMLEEEAEMRGTTKNSSTGETQ
jgi:uncharacterized protein YbaR (Trm112 family)